jgi:hypothetical protein
MSKGAAEIAEQLRRMFLHQSFGIVQFWGMGMMPPNDQSYEVTEVRAEGNRVDIVYVHESRTGHQATISIWDPEGLEAAPPGLGRGIAIRSAGRLALGESEARSEGESFRCKTARGEGVLPKDGAPALAMAR